MSRLSSFLYNMVHRFGHKVSRRRDEKELPGRHESQIQPDMSMMGKRVSIAEEVARQMELGNVLQKRVGGEYQTGVSQPEVGAPAHPVAKNGRDGRTGKAEGGNDSPIPRLRFQKLQEKREEPVRERKNEWKAFGENFFNELREAQLNLWMVGFEELPRSESQSLEKLSDTAGSQGKPKKSRDGSGRNQEPEINVPIWEINPEIAGNVPESIARMFGQKTSFQDRHRLVILLSKKPDMERIKEIGRHLSQTNIQKVLMGGPDMLNLMMEYPEAILDKCTQITFLLESEEITEREKATLSLVQSRIQQETSIPINLECYGYWERKNPVRVAEIAEVATDIHQSTKPALPESENRKHLSLPGNVPTVRQVNAGEETHPAVQQINEPYPAEEDFMSRKPVPAVSFFKTVAPLSSGTSGPQKGEVQPPTEKQIAHAKNLLERLGFNTKVVDEKYRYLGVASSYFGRPLNELFLFMDRQKISFLIDMLKKIEAENRQNQVRKSQLAGSPPDRQPGGSVGNAYPTQPSSPYGEFSSRSVVTGMPSETLKSTPPAAPHLREGQIQNSHPAEGHPVGQSVVQPVAVHHPSQAPVPHGGNLSQAPPADQPTATFSSTPQASRQTETMTTWESVPNKSSSPQMTEATPTGMEMDEPTIGQYKYGRPYTGGYEENRGFVEGTNMGMSGGAMGERKEENRVLQVRPFPPGSEMTR